MNKWYKKSAWGKELETISNNIIYDTGDQKYRGRQGESYSSHCSFVSVSIANFRDASDVGKEIESER